MPAEPFGKLSSPNDGGHVSGTYLENIRDQIDGSRSDYLHYDREGDLWVNDIRIMDLIQYGTPLEVVDTRIIERRCHDWVNLTQDIAREVGFKGGFKYFNAAKANMRAEVISTAYRAGWNAETTSTQDLINLEILTQEGFFDKARQEVICNGFFLDADRFGAPVGQKDIRSQGVLFEADGPVDPAGEIDYLGRIIRMHQQGYKITPIIYDTDELQGMLNRAGIFPVGLRLKFGTVSNDAELAQLTSRFGLSWEQMQQAADIIDQDSNNLRLTTFHAMVSAGETKPLEVFLNSHLFAADKYFALRARHKTLQYLNLGGGIPPLTEKFDHKAFLRRYLTGIKVKAEISGLPEPTIMFELGSFLVSEAAFDVMKIVDHKQNHVDAQGRKAHWAIGDLSILGTVPDIWFLPGKRFTILAINNSTAPAKRVLLGDLTCDGGSVYPEEILVPDTPGATFLKGSPWCIWN